MLTPDEARQINGALDALDAVLAGEADVDAFFPDLVDREPALPEHLEGSPEMTIPMPLGPGADPIAYPLIAQLFTRHGFAQVTPDNFAAWSQRPGRALLLFLEDPAATRRPSTSR